jgi:hypothetical protein
MMHVPGIIASKTPLEMNRFRLSRNQAIEKKLNRRCTQMDADEERWQSPKNQGHDGYSGMYGLDQLFRPVFICVHRR